MLRSLAIQYRTVLSGLSRITTGTPVIAHVDGLRFLAIASVFLFHFHGVLQEKLHATGATGSWGNWLNTAATHGNIGVQLFFSISGFVLALPFASSYFLHTSKPALSRYFLRRITRIEPPYLINLFISTIRLVYKGYLLRDLKPHLIASALYCHNLIYADASSINVVAWSLEIEVQFYVLAPLLCCLFGIRHRALRRFVLLSGMAACHTIALGCSSARVQLSLCGSLQYFLIGLLLADLYVDSWHRSPKTERRWDLLTLAAFLVLGFGLTAPKLLYAVLPVSLILLQLGAFRGTVSRSLLSIPWLTTIGGMCYTMYLYHLYVISGVCNSVFSYTSSLTYEVQLVCQCIAVVGATLLFTSVAFLAWERPFMNREWPQKTYKAITGLLVR